MQYKLIEKYFETELFQSVVIDYFDTVLGSLISKHASTSAKGLFVVNGKEYANYYDMPYHIHILNGLIPALYVYERLMVERGFEKDPEAQLYLKVFMLGFTFHDANKLLGTQQTSDRSDLEVGVAELDAYVAELNVTAFLPDYELYKSNVYYLALATENGSWVASEDYPITLNRDEVDTVMRNLCHFADGIASIQNESLESIEALHSNVEKKLKLIAKEASMRVSYVKVRHNPYTLLSQNLLQVTRKILLKNNKKVLLAIREGFVFWGDPLTEDEYEAIQVDYASASSDDINYLSLTKIDAQKCKFGFIGSAPFSREVLESICEEKGNQFLSLSPNGKEKIQDFDIFYDFTKQLINTYNLPVECKDLDGKLVLSYFQQIESEEDEAFKTIYNLHKIQWLNTKVNAKWLNDFKAWQEEDRKLPLPITIDDETLDSIPKLLSWIGSKVNSVSSLYKTYINFIKTYIVLQDEDTDDYIDQLSEDIIDSLEVHDSGDSVKQQLFDQYFEAPGKSNLRFLDSYTPEVPEKKQMCAFTGGAGKVPYTAVVAFAMKARGFSNRSVTALGNTQSHISKLYAEENKLRSSLYSVSDANYVLYHDFFEARLDIDRDIVTSSIKAKDELKLLEDGRIEFDKTAKFQYNLYNLDFIKLAPKIEPVFFLVRKCLRLVKHIGLRTYISGIMSPYTPHKSVFFYDNPPKFLKLLGWHSIRLVEVEEVLDEMYLILLFGKDRIESNLLKIAHNRGAYFTLYYLFNDEKMKDKLFKTLENFYKKYPHKFKGMTVTENLVKLAVKIDVGYKSGAEETWMIRTAMEYLRKYHKQGNSREDIIQKICGEIYRKLRMEKQDMDDIKAFATAVYDELFVKDWKGEIPAVNIEKDWIYQFAFLYREYSLQHMRTKKAINLQRELIDKKLEVNEENVKKLLPKSMQKYAVDYLQTIEAL